MNIDCQRSHCGRKCQMVGFRIWNDGPLHPRVYCTICGRNILKDWPLEYPRRCELIVPLIEAGKASWSSYREIVDLYRRFATAGQIEHYNIWFDFDEILPTIQAIQRGKWQWPANPDCKYVNVRLDTREAKVRLTNSAGVVITPAQFEYQNPEWATT